MYLVVLNLAFMGLCMPFLIPMGRLLPVGYSLLQKTSDNYGQLCGKLYFFNTIFSFQNNRQAQALMTAG